MLYKKYLEMLTKEYELYMMALFSRYSAKTQAGSQITAQVVVDLRNELTDVTKLFTVLLQQNLKSFFEELDTQPGQYADQFNPMLESIIAQNISGYMNALRRSRGEMASMMKGAHGAIGELLQHNIQHPEIKILDSNNRKWQSDKLFAFVIRNYMYFVESASVINGLRAEGIDLARLVYDNPAHKNNGLVFSISGENKDYPSLEEINASVFHYNASARVEGVYPEK